MDTEKKKEKDLDFFMCRMLMDHKEMEKRIQKEKEERKKKWESGPMLPNMNDLIELPENWRWTKGDSIFSFVTSGSRGWARYYSNSGPIFIRMGNLNFPRLFLSFCSNFLFRPAITIS